MFAVRKDFPTPPFPDAMGMIIGYGRGEVECGGFPVILAHSVTFEGLT